MADKPRIPAGTRDFSPIVVLRRQFILGHIERVFKRYGFQPLETPAMELLSVLTGKYGDEGDQLMYKILNSGDYLSDISAEERANIGYKALTPKIAERALRYDLTVPFARYVAMNAGQLTLPFKRYQMQNVWRADRPQKGRYREFMQCDADVVGSTSLVYEAEIVAMLDQVFRALGFTGFAIKLNHRGVLAALARKVGADGREIDLCVAIDKLDKIGQEGVEKELLGKGFDEQQLQQLDPVFKFVPHTVAESLAFLRVFLAGDEPGLAAVEELELVLKMAKVLGVESDNVQLDLTLARGLNYYTGCIFEAQILNAGIGSVSGGGRYDNLTEVFGVKNMSGVGFSFGIDRLYDAMDALQLFPPDLKAAPQVLVTQFEAGTLGYSLLVTKQLRDLGVEAELYPEPAKMQKQLKYADNRGIHWVIVAGPDEAEKQTLAIKDLFSGTQISILLQDLGTWVKEGL